YAGAYVYGKTRTETTLDASGARKKRRRHLPREQWPIVIKEHHQGYIDWSTYEANQARIAKNTRPRPHNDPVKSGGAVREGGALLQGLANCGHCGRRLRTTIAVETRLPATIVAVSTSSRGVAATVSISEVSRLTRPSRAPSLQHLSQANLPPPSLLP